MQVANNQNQYCGLFIVNLVWHSQRAMTELLCSSKINFAVILVLLNRVFMHYVIFLP